MKKGEIDEYIAKFKELARQGSYTVGNPETTQYFLQGLQSKVLIDVLKPPMAVGYNNVKQRAIQSARLQQLLDSILGGRDQQGANKP